MFWNDVKKTKKLSLSIENKSDFIIQKLDIIFTMLEEIEDYHISNKTMDRFDEYMKNVDKINTMINEFKGCVSLSRDSLDLRKELDQISFDCPIKEETLSKIDYIYYNMGKFADFMQKQEKKSLKHPKKAKKKAKTRAKSSSDSPVS